MLDSDMEEDAAVEKDAGSSDIQQQQQQQQPLDGEALGRWSL